MNVCLVSTEFILRIESVRRRDECGTVVFHFLNSSRNADHSVAAMLGREGRSFLNSSGLSSLHQLVVIGRMWYNGPGQLNFKPHTLPCWFGFQIVIRKPLGIRLMELGRTSQGQTFFVQRGHLFGIMQN
jgi:hypothetical protein